VHPLLPHLLPAGLLQPTAGDAFFYPHAHGGTTTASGTADGTAGLSIRRDMRAIRSSLGVCPQFDVLWPQLSVREHLELFAAIKGYPRWVGCLFVATKAMSCQCSSGRG